MAPESIHERIKRVAQILDEETKGRRTDSKVKRSEASQSITGRAG